MIMMIVDDDDGKDSAVPLWESGGVELLSLTLVYELTPGSIMQLTFVKCIVVVLLDFVVVVVVISVCVLYVLEPTTRVART